MLAVLKLDIAIPGMPIIPKDTVVVVEKSVALNGQFIARIKNDPSGFWFDISLSEISAVN